MKLFLIFIVLIILVIIGLYYYKHSKKPKNRNRRYYDKELVRQAINSPEVQDLINNKKFIGEIQHPEN